MRNLISLADLTAEGLARLVSGAVRFASHGVTEMSLADRRIGVKTSTRTRASFWSAGTALGAAVIVYQPDDLQVNTGETLEDTARVLGERLDALVIRTNSDIDDMRRLGSADGLAVINALSPNEHPTPSRSPTSPPSRRNSAIRPAGTSSASVRATVPPERWLWRPRSPPVSG